MAVSSISLPNPTKVTQDAIISATPGVLVAIQLNGGSTASSMLFHNHASSAGGTELYSIVAPCVTGGASEASSVPILLPDEGIEFDVGCYVDWTGTAAVGWVWFR
jgi:hypothetical protein